MASAEVWQGRVAEWRRSGLTSDQFCEGRDYSAGSLRHWSYQLRKRAKTAGAAAVSRESTPVAFARVVREPTTDHDAIVIDVGAVRVAVRRGFDRETLGAVLYLLTARAGT